MGILTDRLFGRGNEERPFPGYDSGFGGRPDERFARINKQWAYYNGRDPGSDLSQFDYLYQRFETMPRREIEDFENHIRICTDRLRRLLVNSWRGIEIENAETEIRIREMLRANRWPRLLNLMVLYGQVTGDAFLKLVPAPKESKYYPVRIVLLNTESVRLDVSPHDRDDVRSVTVEYGYFYDDDAGKQMYGRYREHIDRQCVTAFIDGVFAPEYSYEHRLGFIPVVHIRNLDNGGDIYGESLVERLIDAQDAVNLIACDLMDIVRYDGHKTTVFQNVHIDKGASRDGATPGEIDLSIGKGLVVKGEGKVYKLEQQHDLGAALQEYERKLDALYDLAGVPRLSRDLVSRMGNLSGRAIERLYQDAIDTTREAQGLYGESIREMVRKIALMAGLGSVEADILWNSDVISPDVDALAKEYEMGARSLRSVMRKLGIRDTDAMFAEIAGEKEAP